MGHGNVAFWFSILGGDFDVNVLKTLRLIDSLREGWYNPPTNYHQKKNEFERLSYQRSAIDEIKLYLMEHENEDPIEMIEKFRKEMDDVSCRSKCIMFSVYYDVATDVLDVLLGVW